MKLAHGNMWSVYDEADMFLITTNSFIKQNGALVMGAGMARQARDIYKGLDLALGRRIDHLGRYGILLSERFPEAKLGAFQVKHHFKDEADLQLIEYSVNMLNDIIKGVGLQDTSIHLNYPGIGNGKLSMRDVKPIVDKLPDCVTLWQLRDNFIDVAFDLDESLDPLDELDPPMLDYAWKTVIGRIIKEDNVYI